MKQETKRLINLFEYLLPRCSLSLLGYTLGIDLYVKPKIHIDIGTLNDFYLSISFIFINFSIFKNFNLSNKFPVELPTETERERLRAYREKSRAYSRELLETEYKDIAKHVLTITFNEDK